MIVLAAHEIEGAVLATGDPSTLVRGVSIDSRTVAEGDLFAALPGERVDGHDYLSLA
ncbi:MAG: Mur ligase family, catalytic domain, partial [Gaiellales bacterium]|nr:Mur ligase family, catalytic domain [Gaiellales bacterium]